MVRRLKRSSHRSGRHPALPEPRNRIPIEVDYPSGRAQAHRCSSESLREARRAMRSQGRRRRRPRLPPQAAQEATLLVTRGVRPHARDPTCDHGRQRSRVEDRAPSTQGAHAAVARTEDDVEDEAAFATKRSSPRSPRMTARLTQLRASHLSPRLATWAQQRGTRPDPKVRSALALARRVVPGGLERNGDRLHRVPRHPALATTSCLDRRRLPGERIAQLYGGQDRTSASTSRPSSSDDPTSTRCASCSRPTPPARASTCSTTATG